jgi:hypothetical protein
MNANSLMIVNKNLTYLGTMPGNDGENDTLPYVATAVKNLESLGYTISENVISRLRRSSVDAITAWYKDTVAAIKEAKGGNVRHRPMYKGFPQEVMDMSEAELYINAIIHYIGRYQLGVLIMPHSEDIDRFPLIHKKELIALDLATVDDIHDFALNIMRANGSISEEYKKTLEWYFLDFGSVSKIRMPSPNDIPNKENKAVIGKMLFEMKLTDLIPALYNTATDVLRFVVALSDGDVSLATKTKFRNFKRSERKFILGMLENMSGITEDLYRHRNAWLRLGEKLHPGDYMNQFPYVNATFDELRNQKFTSFRSVIEQLIEAGDVKGAAAQLLSRPGEFARRLDKLLRHCDDNTVMNLFETVADQVSTPVLIQVRDHFKNRNLGLPRFAIPKGPVAKLALFPDATGEVDNYTTSAMVTICEEALMNRFAEMDKLGKIYVDPRMKNFLLPTAQRSANPGLLQVTRGSKFDIDEGDTLRFFIYWKGYEDIDLSATFFDKYWCGKGHISYIHLRNNEYNCCHSGDITAAPDGASEFIDMDINKLKSAGVRYVAFNIMVYSGTFFDDMDTCFGGWMVRQNDTGEIYEPKTVQNKFDITTHTRTVIPAIFDIETRQVIWVDMSLKNSGINNVENGMSQIQAVGDTFSKMDKMTLQELFVFHGLARDAEFVTDREEADIVFAEDGDVRPFDLDVIMAEYMS